MPLLLINSESEGARPNDNNKSFRLIDNTANIQASSQKRPIHTSCHKHYAYTPNNQTVRSMWDQKSHNKRLNCQPLGTTSLLHPHHQVLTIIHRRIGSGQPHVKTKSSDSYDQMIQRKIHQRIESSASWGTNIITYSPLKYVIVMTTIHWKMNHNKLQRSTQYKYIYI